MAHPLSSYGGVAYRDLGTPCEYVGQERKR
jgi:hypothetical protein